MRTGEVCKVDDTLEWRFLGVVNVVIHNNVSPQSVTQLGEVVERLWRRNMDVSLELRPLLDCGRVCQIVFKRDWTLEARAVRPPDVVVNSTHSWDLLRPLNPPHNEEGYQIREEDSASEGQL